MNTTQSGLVAIGSPDSKMRKLTEKKYTFYEDAGHGWLAVPVTHLRILNILDKISGYSYRNGSVAFLEEDCDYSVFADTWEQFTGLKIGEYIDSVYDGDSSGIRNFAGFYL